MPTQLDQILAHTLLEVTARKAVADFGLLESMAAAHTPRGFRAGLLAAAKSGKASGFLTSTRLGSASA